FLAIRKTPPQPSHPEEVVHGSTYHLPLSLSYITWKMKLPGWKSKTTVVVGTMMDDVHIVKLHKLKDGPAAPVHPQGWGKEIHLPSAGWTIPRALALPCSLKGPEVYWLFSKVPGTLHNHTKSCMNSNKQTLNHSRGLWVSHGYKN
ncbi:60S ribosomal protein L18, partial [Galemys pyrenaicus]